MGHRIVPGVYVSKVWPIALGLVACTESIELVPSAGFDAATDLGVAICVRDGLHCATDTDCCSGRCAASSMCAASGCAPIGAACGSGAACCGGSCVTGACAAITGCAPIGELCSSVDACCSLVCASDGSGRRTCQSLGGCLPQGELCRSDADCCGGVGSCANLDPITHAGRCVEQSGCATLGEICRVPGVSSATRSCCMTSTEHTQCRPTGAGVDRCRAATTCLPAGMSCDVPDDCCTGVCASDGSGGLVCQDACRGGGETCTRSADCCTATCSNDICLGSRMCVPLGGACTTSDACCSQLCSSGTCQSPPT